MVGHRRAFHASADVLDRLNLRASFGVTGNDNIDGMYGYSYLSGVNYLGSAVGLKLANLANSSLKWEKTRKVECRNRSGVPERPDRSEFRLFSAQDQRLADVEAGSIGDRARHLFI